jgi:nicotinamide mononucleotide (NMN) deamidase PncC
VSTSATQIVRRIHDAPLRLVLAVTGGGASAIDHLLIVPGASRSVLEATVPYAADALRRFLGGRPEHFCAPETARAMAMAAFQRAVEYAKADESLGDVPLAGVGCTASLASDRPKRGSHRAHVALQTNSATCTHSLELQKDRRTRRQEEQLLGRWLLNVIAAAAEVQGTLELRLLEDEHIESSRTDALPGWQALLLGRERAVRHGPEAVADGAARRAIFPGAFHPRHSGHVHLADVARRRLGVPVEHEISVLNVDKPPLDYTEMKQRLDPFGPAETLWFTRAPLFQEKADLFPGATFIVGADTIERIGEPRYYGEAASRDRAIAHLAERGCRFLVFGRLMGETFRTLDDLPLPPALRALCTEIPAAEFREDISSTELRERSAAHSA